MRCPTDKEREEMAEVFGALVVNLRTCYGALQIVVLLLLLLLLLLLSVLRVHRVFHPQAE